MSIPQATGLTRRLTLTLAIAGGAAVSNLYWAQPLLAEIANSLGVSVGAAGLAITTTQIGYASGILLVVPLGDSLNRRRLIPAMMLCSAGALALSALAPTFAILLVALALVGVTTIAGQLLTPLAGDLANPEQRGHVVGTVVSGLLTGILLSRAISGIVAAAFGWRAIFAFASVAMIVTSVVLARTLPQDLARAPLRYGTLLASVFRSVAQHRPVQVILGIGSLTFAVFTMFWTALTFLLSQPPFSFSTASVGLTSLVGFAGAFAARRAGILYDRGLSVRGVGMGLALAASALALAAAGAGSIVFVLAAALLLGVAIQVVNVLNQARMFAIDSSARSRLNTAFVVGNFIGGAIGSTLAGVLWSRGGWLAVTVCEGFLISIALSIWFFNRRALAPPV